MGKMGTTELSFDIPFIKLIFYAKFFEDSTLPAEKVSMLRGGMGEMMLRQHCPADRKCVNCRFERGCIVRNAFYSRMNTCPSYVTGQESVGYLIECEDHRESYREGECLLFNMILFGDSITYFFIYLQALVQLGAEGVGKYKAHFFVAEVRNAKGGVILSDNRIDKNQYQVDNVADYVRRRKNYLMRLKENETNFDRENGLTYRQPAYQSSAYKNREQTLKFYEIEFRTPLSMKYRGEFMSEFNAHAIVDGACRRLQMLNYYTGQGTELPQLDEYPQIAEQSAVSRSIRRYSSTQDTKVILRGIVGRMIFDTMPDICLDYLLAGELLHIGKNTSFGFGKYLIHRRIRMTELA